MTRGESPADTHHFRATLFTEPDGEQSPLAGKVASFFFEKNLRAPVFAEQSERHCSVAAKSLDARNSQLSHNSSSRQAPQPSRRTIDQFAQGENDRALCT